MNILPTMTGLCLLAITLTACGSDEKTTVYHDRPVVVQQPASSSGVPSNVENGCAHGYDNSSHSCY
jgi:hypothetical protein